MKANFRVLLDACVLATHPVCDLLLRLGEEPKAFVPLWSERILDEVYSVHTEKLKRPWPSEIAASFQQAVRKAFPEALVTGFEQIEPIVDNDEGDRHVLAAAIRGGATLVVTFNVKDFPSSALELWDLTVCTPDDYLLVLVEHDLDLVLRRITEIAARHGRDREDELYRLGRWLPNTVAHLLAALQDESS